MPQTIQKDRTYGEICRDQIDQICESKGISRTKLAKRMRVHPQTLMSRAYKGLLSFKRALQLAKMADASMDTYAELERAWFTERAAKDSRGATRRLLRLTERYQEELNRMEEFLQSHGLLDKYLAKRTWNPHRGLIEEELSKARARK